MRKIFFAIMVVLLLNIGIPSAHEHNFDETKQLINLGISCDKLTDEQLESIGDYYMEQMHPGEAHEMTNQMMGGEGSESLSQVHINMAKRLYCNEDVGGMMGGGMMNVMIGNNMMGSGMMGNFPKRGKESETPINILQKRYAKGEINKKQFDEMKKELRK